MAIIVIAIAVILSIIASCLYLGSKLFIISQGYPNGYAQLIHSPDQWIVEPMQIDTHNRNFSINDQVGLQV